MNSPALDIWDRRLAAPMFAATIVFLMLLGASAEWIRWQGGRLPAALIWSLVGVYGIFVAEGLFHFARRDPYRRQRLPVCLFPPLRLCGRDFRTGRYIWTPLSGWAERDARLAADMERAFSMPMIGVALMILPLLAIENFWSAVLAENTLVRVAVSLATCLVWLAFTVEFFVMIAVVPNKLDYCKRHWIDIMVICLPFVAFLRFVRVGQALRLQQLSKVGSKLGRAYRLRGVTMRAWRSVLLLNLIARVARVSPEKQLEKLRHNIAEKETELELLRERVRELESLIAASECKKQLSLSDASEG